MPGSACTRTAKLASGKPARAKALRTARGSVAGSALGRAVGNKVGNKVSRGTALGVACGASTKLGPALAMRVSCASTGRDVAQAQQSQAAPLAHRLRIYFTSWLS